MDVAVQPGLIVRGMWGIGDNIHSRAVLRELMKQYDVWLDSCCVSMFHDLIAQGLHIVPRPRGSGAAARMPDAKGRWQFEGLERFPPSHIKERRNIGYNKEAIQEQGSILAAQFASVGLSMPEKPDFSLSVPQLWRDKAAALLDKADKPVLVYRPVILNNGWQCPSRAPDISAYDELYRRIRNRFYTVGVANVVKDQEWVEGPQPDVDLDLTHGELDFETMAGLFSLAAMVFGNAGFVPVLAQAVGTPNVIVYGGNECFNDTNRVGAHLAHTLAIEPDTPCACHVCFHNCNKTITLEPALKKLDVFTDNVVLPTRTLIFATVYADTKERAELTERWVNLHSQLNPTCDFLVVDSKSPVPFNLGPVGTYPVGTVRSDRPQSGALSYYSFEENIGHLSRNGPEGPGYPGRDGWGRAFCFGLQAAINDEYDYVVHIEGDSLLRLPVMPIIQEMLANKSDVVSVPVKGTRTTEIGWVETGLMFFRTQFIVESDFIARYDWDRTRKGNKKTYKSGTPEAVIFRLLGDNLRLMDWKALRGDKNQITPDDVSNLDWVTHCRTSDRLDDISLYDRFIEHALGKSSAPPAPVAQLVKINLGCGENKLTGWQNHDADIDITAPLPFNENSAACIFAEHVVEHVDYYAALRFFAECRRVLAPGGVLRISVPSIENVMRRADEEYCTFVRRWVTDPSITGVRAGMHNILFFHGHKMAWTDSLLEASLFYAGFGNLTRCEPGQSTHADLVGVEGHGKVIGDKMNWIESSVWEGTAEK